MLNKAYLFYILVIALVTAGCQPGESGDFAIYLLAQDVASVELAKVDLDQLALEEGPIISAEDIVTYDQTTHEIELTQAAYARIQQIFPLPVKVDGIPFVVCVGEQPIYAGAFWTPLSSLSFDGVVIMQPFETDGTTIRIVLGYPGPDAFMGRDPRADERVMKALQAAGKLK